MNDVYLSVLACLETPLTLAEKGHSLSGKVALVSMSGSGRGRELALEFAAYGASIIVADSEIDSAEITAEAIRSVGGKAIAVSVDISIQSQVEMLVKYARGIFGSLEFVVNQAGNIYKISELIDSKESEWGETLTQNSNASKSIN